MDELDRGTSLLKAEGGYSHRDQRVVYAVVDPSEVSTVRRIVDQVDPKLLFPYLQRKNSLAKVFLSSSQKSIFKLK